MKMEAIRIKIDRSLRKKYAAKRVFALAMSAVLLLVAVPFMMTTSTTADGCTHTHDNICGYAEPSSCNHACSDGCGFKAASACIYVHVHSDACVDEDGEFDCTDIHTHNGSCGYAELVPCGHNHDNTCGFVTAAPCGHVCSVACGGVASSGGQPEDNGQTGDGDDDADASDECDEKKDIINNTSNPDDKDSNDSGDNSGIPMSLDLSPFNEDFMGIMRVSPIFDSASATADDTIVITFSLDIDGDTVEEDGSDFTLTVSGNGITITDAVASGSTITLTLSEGITSGQTVTISYSGSSILATSGDGGDPLAAFGPEVVDFSSFEWVFDISLDVSGTHDFGKAEHGYSGADFDILDVEITNEGNQDTGALTIALTDGDTTSFKLTPPSTVSSINVGETGSFTVEPDTGLAVGEYEATVSVTGTGGISDSFTVIFEVEKPAATASATAAGWVYDGTNTNPGFTGLTFTATGSSTDITTEIGSNYTVTYTNRGGTVYNSATPPTNAGDYTATFTINADQDYTGSGTVDFTVALRPVAITGVNHTREYDNTPDTTGMTAAMITIGVVSGNPDSGLIDSSTATVSTFTAVYSSSSVGTKTVDFSALTLIDGDFANYTVVLPANDVPNAGNGITPIALTITGATHTKVYDGDTAASGVNIDPATQLTGWLGSNPGSITVDSVTATYLSANAGATTLNISAVALDGTGAENYTVTANANVTNAGSGITPIALTITGATHTKVYDGDTAASGVNIDPATQLTGWLGGSPGGITVDSVTATYLSANAGATTLNISAVELDGTGAGNYTVTANANVTNTGSGITKADQNLTADDINNRTVTSGSMNLDGHAVSDAGAQSGDITYAVVDPGDTGADFPVDNITVTYTAAGTARIKASAAGSTNFNPADVEFNLNIVSTPDHGISLSLSGSSTFPTLTYGYTDGSQGSLTITVENIGANATGALTYALSGDGETSFSLSATGIANIAVGGSTTFTVTPGNRLGAGLHEATVTVSGGNGINDSFNVSFSVGQATLTPTSIGHAGTTSRVYDRTTSLPGTPTVSFSGAAYSDTPTYTATFAFSNANVGNNKEINATGITLTSTTYDNYTLSENSLTNQSSSLGISELQLIWSLQASNTVQNKVYDGNATATVLSAPTFTNVIAGDNITVNAGTVSFSDANAGAGKTVTAAGYGFGGISSANYSAPAAQPLFANANITQRQLVWSAQAGNTVQNKEYDGLNAATVNNQPTFTNIVGSDGVTVTNGSVTFNTVSAGDNKPVTAASYGFSGDTVNYSAPAAQPLFANANITRKAITISGVSATDRAYNGTNIVALTGGSLNDVIAADTGSVGFTPGNGTMANANASETPKAVTTNIILTGTAAGNYTLTQPTGITVNISRVDYTYTIAGTQNIKIGSLLSAVTAPAAGSGVGGEAVSGTLRWFAGEADRDANTNPLPSEDATQFTGAAGSTVTLYWRFAATNANYFDTAKTGQVVFTIIALSDIAGLSSITIDNGTLTPDFNENTLNYAVEVDNSVESITVTATPVSSGAVVNGDGVIALDVGENVITIEVTAEDGVTKKNYTITVTRAEPDTSEPPQTVPGNDGAVPIPFTETDGAVTLIDDPDIIQKLIDTAANGMVSFNLSGISGATSVTISAAVLEQIVAKGHAIQVTMPNGSITFSSAAAAALAAHAKANGGNITLSLYQPSISSLPAAQQSAINTGDAVFRITVSSGGAFLSNFNGMLSVTVPFNGPFPVDVWHLSANGNLTRMQTQADPANRNVTFTTTHLSVYVVKHRTQVLDTTTGSPQTGDYNDMLAWRVVLFTSVLGILLTFISRVQPDNRRRQDKKMLRSLTMSKRR